MELEHFRFLIPGARFHLKRLLNGARGVRMQLE